jgi:hypothetical protein
VGIWRSGIAVVRLGCRGLGNRLFAALLVAGVVTVLSPSRVCAQQNLFNVPVPDTARPYDIFFQQQLNVGLGARLGTAYTTLDYGLPRNWEVGLNAFNVQIYPGGNPPELGNADQSGLLVNGQKVFKPIERLSFGIGMQAGVSSTNATGATDFLRYNWFTAMYEPRDGQYGRYIVGLYYGNDSYLGRGNNVGYLLGCEIPLIRERLSFQADYISGINNSSVAVVGFVANVYRDWQFSLGMQFPSPGSPNSTALVFELTHIPGLKARPFFGRPISREDPGERGI